MLQFYYNRLSNNARRVWMVLLEKNLEFEPIQMRLDGDQFQPEFLEMNPFHHVPVLVDDGFKIIESLAILDYLEAKYPAPALMPSNPQDIAKVRMLELVHLSEMVPTMYPLMREAVGLEVGEKEREKNNQHRAKVLKFYEDNLNDDSYFIEGQFTLADIVVGVSVSLLPFLNFSLEPYPRLHHLLEKIEQRESWQKTQATQAEMATFKSRVKEILSKL